MYRVKTLVSNTIYLNEWTSVKLELSANNLGFTVFKVSAEIRNYISGEVIEHGQIYKSLLNYFSDNPIFQRIFKLWKRWHGHDERYRCTHQYHKDYEIDEVVLVSDFDCKQCGHHYGNKLYEFIPDLVMAEIIELMEYNSPAPIKSAQIDVNKTLDLMQQPVLKSIYEGYPVPEIEVHYKNPVPFKNRIQIKSNKDVIDVFNLVFPKDSIDHREYLWVMYINTHNQVIGLYLIGIGGVYELPVDQRIIFQVGLKLNASGFILCHNHPSGNINFSSSDKKIAERLKEIGQLIGIKLVDFIIINGEGDFNSTKSMTDGWS
jgi:DNA repair protein RadC